jgi:hypothetical protein
MSDYFRVLGGNEAVEILDKDPEQVLFPLASFMNQFGISWEELRSEAMSGRLVATGTKVSGGFDNVAISAAAAMRWLSHPKTPKQFRERVSGRKPIQ